MGSIVCGVEQLLRQISFLTSMHDVPAAAICLILRGMGLKYVYQVATFVATATGVLNEMMHGRSCHLAFKIDSDELLNLHAVFASNRVLASQSQGLRTDLSQGRTRAAWAVNDRALKINSPSMQQTNSNQEGRRVWCQRLLFWEQCMLIYCVPLYHLNWFMMMHMRM